MAVNVSNGLREALIETLNNILSPMSEVRKSAEEHIKLLEVTEEYGVHLVELTLNQNGSLLIRQLSSVLLKQYVEAHWCEDSEKFRVPICPEYVKIKIKEMLPHGLYEPIGKVRTSVAYAISAIAHWDWPEQWHNLFDLLMLALKSGEEAPVHGAMRVLTEFSRDLTDQHIPQVAPVILPEMYRIFCEEQVYSIRTRGRAVDIFSTIANMICMMAQYNKSHAKTLLFPTLPAFIQALVKGLQAPDGYDSDFGLKKEILNAFTMLLKNVPKQMSQYLGEILGPVWVTLTSSASIYVNTTVNHLEEIVEPTDCDGEVLGLENLIFTIFEFVHALVDTTRHKEMVRQGLHDLIYYLILYMQITEEQIHNWTTNPDTFVEDEDEDTFAYSVRICGQELLQVLSEELHDSCGSSLILAVTRHLERAQNQRASNDPAWWKIHEAVMLALGSTRELIIIQLTKQKLDFDICNFMETIVLADMDPNLSTFLSGRALWFASRFCRVMNTSQVNRFLEGTVSALSQSPDPILRVFAVSSVWGFCESLKSTGSQSSLAPFLQPILEGLVSMATQASSEILALILETCCILVTVDPNFTSSNVTRIATLSLAVFIKANNDPVLVQLVQDLVKELSSNQGCTTTVQSKFVPTLTSILVASSDKVPAAMQSVALDMLEVMVRSSSAPLSKALMSEAFPAVAQCTLRADDLSTLQNGGECLRAFVSVSPQQVVDYRDPDGRSGLEYAMQVALYLLSPSAAESTAVFVGKLITALMRKMTDHLGDSLDQLLRAVLSKLQGSETLAVVQSLVLVYAHLIHSQLEAVIGFLGGVPGPTGQSALAFVLLQWCSKQHLFYGNYERKITAVALAKLLEHGVTTNDTRLQGIIVQGDQIFAMDEKVRTRSQRSGQVERWTQIPVLVKMFKLIIYELSNAIDANMGKDDLNNASDDDEDDIEEENDCWQDLNEGNDRANGELAMGGNDLASFFPCTSFAASDLDTVDEEDDPDALSDPIFTLDLQQYLSNYIATFTQHPAFVVFAPHLNPHEKEVLLGIGIQC